MNESRRDLPQVQVIGIYSITIMNANHLEALLIHHLTKDLVHLLQNHLLVMDALVILMNGRREIDTMATIIDEKSKTHKDEMFSNVVIAKNIVMNIEVVVDIVVVVIIEVVVITVVVANIEAVVDTAVAADTVDDTTAHSTDKVVTTHRPNQTRFYPINKLMSKVVVRTKKIGTI